MRWLVLVFSMAAAYHTISYGRWAWQQGYKPGAVGTVVVSVMAVLFSILAGWVWKII